MSKSDLRILQTEIEAGLDDVTALVAQMRTQIEALPDDAPPPPPPPPQIFSASVNPSSLPFGGGMVTISAATLNATTLTLDGQVITDPLPWTVECLVTRTFVLGAIGPGGTDAVSLPVTVAAAPPAPPLIENLRCEPAVLPAGGGAVRINATISNADGVYLNGRSVTLPWTENIFETTRYVVLATGPGGSVQAEVTATVPVVVPPPALPVVETRLTPRMSRLIIVNDWMPNPDRYNRAQFNTVARPDANGNLRVRAFACDLAAGGAWPAWGADMLLTLTLTKPDGTVTYRGAVTALAAAKEATWTFPAADVDEGWYKADVSGGDAFGWDAIWYGIYVLKGAQAQPHALMPSITASYELTHMPAGSPYAIQFAWVPTTYNPYEAPLPMREYPPVVARNPVPAGYQALSREMLVCEEVSPLRVTDVHRPVVSDEGIWSTFNSQNYNFFDFEARRPLWPLLSGRRGKASLPGVMHVEWGTAVVNQEPFNGRVDNVYFTDTWGFGKILLGKYRGADYGKVVRLIGYEHDQPAPYRSATSTRGLRLLGDWSAIPPERHGMCRVWGIGWDSRAMVTDEAAAPIPAERNLKPHDDWLGHAGQTMSAGIRVFLPDLRGNRVLMGHFSPTSHAAPAVITEFVTGLNQPFDCIELGARSGYMAISDTFNNRVIVVSLDDGTIVAQFATLRPEGLAFQDGWLHYGSLPGMYVKRRTVSIVSGSVTFGPEVTAVTLSRPWQVNDNSRYVKIALSDGTFGPRGMIGVQTWSNIYYGCPLLFMPGEGVTQNINWLWRPQYGDPIKGPIYSGDAALSYGTCVAFGNGSMFAGTVQDGLLRFSAVLPTDPVLNGARYSNGVKLWRDNGLHLTRGNHGWSFDGSPPPFGIHADIDYMLEVHGHMRTP